MAKKHSSILMFLLLLVAETISEANDNSLNLRFDRYSEFQKVIIAISYNLKHYCETMCMKIEIILTPTDFFAPQIL